MTDEEATERLTDEEQQRAFDEWVQRELNSHATHLFKAGLIDGRVEVAIAWALPGRLCIGTVASKADKGKAFWVISGDVPTDHLDLKQAATAREAAKHFALKWQLQAVRLAESQAVGSHDDDPRVFTAASTELTRKAEALYALTEQDEHWQTEIIG